MAAVRKVLFSIECYTTGMNSRVPCPRWMVFHMLSKIC